MNDDQVASVSSRHPVHTDCTVILLCADLMMTSTVGGTARARGINFLTVNAMDAAVAAVLQAVQLRHSLQLFVDLSVPGLNLADLTAEVPADVVHQAVAYGPHVHGSLLQAARATGFGHVLSRGAFSQRFSEFFPQRLPESLPEGD